MHLTFYVHRNVSLTSATKYILLHFGMSSLHSNEQLEVKQLVNIMLSKKVEMIKFDAFNLI